MPSTRKHVLSGSLGGWCPHPAKSSGSLTTSLGNRENAGEVMPVSEMGLKKTQMLAMAFRTMLVIFTEPGCLFSGLRAKTPLPG